MQDNLNSVLKSLKPENDPKKIIDFDIRIDEISGKIVFCNSFTLSPNSMADNSMISKTIKKAFKHPGRTIQTSANMAQFKSRIKLPRSIKDLFFQTTKHTIKITPEITENMLRENGLKYDDVVSELLKECPFYIRY